MTETHTRYLIKFEHCLSVLIFPGTVTFGIDHFTVVCSVTRVVQSPIKVTQG